MRFRGPIVVLLMAASAVGIGWAVAVDNAAIRPMPAQSNSVTATNFTAPNNLVPASKPALPAPEPPSDSALGFMLVQVSEQYQHTSRYPSYSVPLTKDQADAYAGNHYNPIVLPLSNGGEFTVSLEKYRFTRGETLLIVASLSGPMVVGHRMSARLEATAHSERVATTELSAAEGGFMEGVIDSDITPGEYRLIVAATVDGKPLRHVSTLTIEPDLGRFEGIGSVRIQDNDLVIPFEFAAKESGYYALSGQLFNNNQPIAHLTAEHQLTSGHHDIPLKAHGSVLASHEINGPMQLKNLQIRRLPMRPGDRTDFAFGPDDGFEFSPPDLDSLIDEPARDPLSQQRVTLLKNMAGKF
ncbi:hypothetical protein [Marinobacter caseinilyticus]|uniref:hypothetical protein n=1 Tax=Marinobacter caseinilyticus TaxID=2692195 RepID=UPI00140C9177|nr:hypothetical protein [Marinobacter caseinilyticus]